MLPRTTVLVFATASGNKPVLAGSPHAAHERRHTMGILARLFGREKEVDLSGTGRYRSISGEPPVSAEQEAASRDLMERQMTDSRTKRDASDAAAAEAASEEKTE